MLVEVCLKQKVQEPTWHCNFFTTNFFWVIKNDPCTRYMYMYSSYHVRRTAHTTSILKVFALYVRQIFSVQSSFRHLVSPWNKQFYGRLEGKDVEQSAGTLHGVSHSRPVTALAYANSVLAFALAHCQHTDVDDELDQLEDGDHGKSEPQAGLPAQVRDERNQLRQKHVHTSCTCTCTWW